MGGGEESHNHHQHHTGRESKRPKLDTWQVSSSAGATTGVASSSACACSGLSLSAASIRSVCHPSDGKDGLPKRYVAIEAADDTTGQTFERSKGIILGASSLAAMAGKLGISGSPARPSEASRCGSKGQIRTIEFIRLIQQALYSMGFVAAAKRLEEESQVIFQADVVTEFRQSLLEGQLDRCLALLDRMPLAMAEAEKMKEVRFLLLQQKFLELLEVSDVKAALQVLRSQLAPLGVNIPRLHQLSSWVMCGNFEDLRQRSGWKGKEGGSRYDVLLQLQGLLPPSVLIPERRLEQLIEQAMDVQLSKCLFHNTVDSSFSLFHDHLCSSDQLPKETMQVLEEHDDEVWYLHFSHDGKRLASASKDKTAIIWEVIDEYHSRVQHRLQGHTAALSFVAWSPDDSHLLTCGNDFSVRLWDTQSGACLRVLLKHTEAVTACAWFPEGKRFVSGGLDKCIYMWSVEGGQEPESWKAPDMPRIHDLAISWDGKHMVTLCNEKEIRIHNFETGSDRTLMEMTAITSLSMSSDGNCFLVNLSTGCIHLWDVSGEGLPTKPAFKYRGQVQGRFVIRSCFGGSNELFIASGSEDSQVYIWHRGNGSLLEKLPGHTGTVNAVSWNPTNPHMLASASDDKTIRIWGGAIADGRIRHGGSPSSFSSLMQGHGVNGINRVTGMNGV